MKHRLSKPQILVIILIVLAVVISSAGILYVRCTSDFVTSSDGLWRAGAYRPEMFRELWTGQLFYYGDDPVGDVIIECQTEEYDEIFRYEVPPSTQVLNSYARFLAQRPISAHYDFHALTFGNPKLVEVVVTWTTSAGTCQTQRFSFS